MSNQNLRNFFLIKKIENGIATHVNGEVSIGFKMSHYPFGISSPETQKNIFDYLTKLLRNFPEGTWLQKQDFFYKRFVLPDNQRHYSQISIENLKYYSMRETLGHASFLFINFTPEAYREYTLSDSQFVRMINLLKAPFKKVSKEMESTIKGTQVELSKGINGFRGEILNDQQWQKVLYAFYSGSYNLEDWELPSTLDLGNYTITDEGYLQREEKLFASVYMGREPEQPIKLSDKWKVVATKKEGNFVYHPNEDIENYAAFPINAGLPFPHVTTVSIQRANGQKVIDGINREIDKNSFSKVSNTDDKRNPDAINHEEAETAKGHALGLKDQIARGSYPACSYGVSVILPDTNVNDLAAKIEATKTAFGQYSAKAEFNRSHNMPLFFASAPGHAHNGHDLIPSRVINALPFLNINSYENTSSDGILYKDSTTGYPINFEPWNNPDMAEVRNSYYAGPTRGGKSVMVSNETDYFYNHGYHQVIVEKGRSYEWLTIIYGGEYIVLRPDSKVGINLFDYHPDKISELQKTIIVNVLSGMYPDRNPKVYAAVTSMLENYNSFCSGTVAKPSIEGFYNFYTEDFMNSETVYKNHMDFVLFQEELKRFVHGANKWLFNNENNVAINHKRFVVFELKELESSPLFNLALEAILGLINAKLEFWNREIRFLIRIDEALQAFRTERGGELLGDFYTQVGKFNAAISIMVQSVSLLTDLPAFEAVETNTQLRVFTYNEHLDGWAETQVKKLGWSSHRLRLLKSLRSLKTGREHLMIVGGKEMIVNLELSPIAAFAFSTTAEVRNKVLKLHKENPQRGIKELIFDQYYNKESI